MLGLLHKLSDCLTDLKNGKPVVPLLVESDFTDSDSASVENQTDELGQFLDSAFAPGPAVNGD